MYSFDFPGGPYYKYERCLSDDNVPKQYNCSNMGLSAGNYHISTVWIEINDDVATSLTAGAVINNVTAHFLPLDPKFEAISSPYPVTKIELAAAPTYHSTGLYSLTSDPTRDATWKIISVPSYSTFTAGENAYIMSAHPLYLPASAAAGWIGVTTSGENFVTPGDYQFQTTFSLPSSSCESLEVSFAADDGVKSVVVSDGTSSNTIYFDATYRWSFLTSFTVTGLGSITTITFTVSNADGGPTGLLVQFGSLTGCR